MSSNPSSISSGLLAAGTTTVIARKTRLNGFIVLSDGTNLATVTVYDNASTNSGTVLAKALSNASQPTSIQSYDTPVRADLGLTVVVSGTGSGAILYFDA